MRLDDEGLSPSAEGLSSTDPFEDPAWICVRGPLLEAHENRTSLLGIYSFESSWEDGLWDVSSDCPLMGYSRQGPGEEGYLVGRSLALVESVLRAPEEGAPEAHRSHTDVSRYETIPSNDYPSPIFSVFGRPLLSRGSSGLGDFHGYEVTGEMEPLRVVSDDEREWGEVTTGALMEVDQETVGFGTQSEELPYVRPECLGYKNWEDSCLIKFSEFLGVPMVGFEEEILELMRKMVSQQSRDKRKGNPTESRCERELRKFECTTNYNGKGQNRGGRDGEFFVKVKMKLKLFSWNVRGANNSNKRNVIRNFIRSQRVDLVCL